MSEERAPVPNLAYRHTADRLLLRTLIHGPSTGLIEPTSSGVAIQDPESGFTEAASDERIDTTGHEIASNPFAPVLRSHIETPQLSDFVGIS